MPTTYDCADQPANRHWQRGVSPNFPFLTNAFISRNNNIKSLLHSFWIPIWQSSEKHFPPLTNISLTKALQLRDGQPFEPMPDLRPTPHFAFPNLRYLARPPSWTTRTFLVLPPVSIELCTLFYAHLLLTLPTLPLLNYLSHIFLT